MISSRKLVVVTSHGVIEGVPRTGIWFTRSSPRTSFTAGAKVAASRFSLTSPQFVWHVTEEGLVTEIARVPEALFFNGGTAFLDGHLLAVDSTLGRIYDVDLAAGSVRPWFAHELLEKVTAEPMLPGVNGIKVFGNHVYVSNTDRALFLRIAFDERRYRNDVNCS